MNAPACTYWNCRRVGRPARLKQETDRWIEYECPACGSRRTIMKPAFPDTSDWPVYRTATPMHWDRPDAATWESPA